MENSKRPKISIAKIVQHANDIAVACRMFKPELQDAGLQWYSVDKLVILSRACSEADTYYQLKKEDLQSATKQHQGFVKECRKLRGDLRENINRTFKKIRPGTIIPGLYKKMAYPEIAQDLLDLVNICSNNRKEFEMTNFNFSLVQKAAGFSRELFDANVDLELQRSSIKHEELATRDSLYYQLYKLIIEVCDFCRSVFKDDPGRRNIFRSIR
ncbi:MAG: hypothetical protein GXY86_05985 [Firmicutes bacterium]|nr:hypothetical protein [Bacillota bacterium]